LDSQVFSVHQKLARFDDFSEFRGWGKKYRGGETRGFGKLVTTKTTASFRLLLVEQDHRPILFFCRRFPPLYPTEIDPHPRNASPTLNFSPQKNILPRDFFFSKCFFVELHGHINKLP
jgi:hypothetical protein